MDLATWIALVAAGSVIGLLARFLPGAKTRPESLLGRFFWGATALVRHLVALVALPITVAVFIPLWINERYGVEPSLPRTGAGLLAAVLGGAFLLVGLALFCSCLYRFARQGRGTLAPWDPPRGLVVDGPYRFVRNPMISGVVFVLIGEALLLRSGPHGTWAATFLVINLIYIPLLEEPQLAARFGDEYRRYREHVPGLVPRPRPWRADDNPAGDPPS